MSSLAMCPFDVLPDDILRAIFQLCCAEKDANGIEYLCMLPLNAGFRPFQSTLTRVCQRWRNIVFDTHLLWSSIGLVGPDVEQTVLYLDLALHQSGEAPLDILAVACGWKTLTTLLAPNAHRLRTLSVRSIRDWTPIQPNGSLPALEHLEFRFFQAFDTFYESISAAFANTPALRRITCSPTLAVHVTFPWTQIVELCIHPESRFGSPIWIPAFAEKKCLFDIIAIAPLRLLICTDNVRSGFPAIIKPDIEVAQLPLGWLPHFTLPSLREYTICATQASETKAMLALIHRSGCTLTHLRIVNFNGTAANVKALEDLLLALPHLEELDLHVPTRDECFSHWKLLQPLLKDKNIVPNLRAMRLRIKRIGRLVTFRNDDYVSLVMLSVFGGAQSVVDAGRKKLRFLELDFRDPGAICFKKAPSEAEIRERLVTSADAARINLFMIYK
ncbi:hypothetical protein CYLTODRAFT_426764 [Cylindrobasidium torrendii FP15055 ss-10]|uniref:Uncharacterized protein n=1 Tax=Cylindrobasidium torrendii FP15055 ss-10 TaxID=1314674 RepID=A0A0D7AXB9_9AGAR|nr:hypothetical protein CYLTODRAFT_426764 [Cylindrobasidium torrendii FP15055 ss-10]